MKVVGSLSLSFHYDSFLTHFDDSGTCILPLKENWDLSFPGLQQPSFLNDVCMYIYLQNRPVGTANKHHLITNPKRKNKKTISFAVWRTGRWNCTEEMHKCPLAGRHFSAQPSQQTRALAGSAIWQTWPCYPSSSGKYHWWLQKSDDSFRKQPKKKKVLNSWMYVRLYKDGCLSKDCLTEVSGDTRQY